jgi:hypothetical protein
MSNSNASTKTFDMVDMVRAVRDELNARTATMSSDEENCWLCSMELSDPTLRRLMKQAAQQAVAVDDTSGRG